MNYLISAISVYMGFTLAIALILLIKYLEYKDKVIFWWAVGCFFLASHALLEMLELWLDYNILSFLMNWIWALTAVAFFQSVGWMRRPISKAWFQISTLIALTALAFSFTGVYVMESWYMATVPVSIINAAGFIVCAYFFLKMVEGQRSISVMLVFYGFVFLGLHNLDYPFARASQWFAPYDFALGSFISIIFSVGLIMRSSEEFKKTKDKTEKTARNFSILNTIAVTLSRAMSLDKLFSSVLEKVMEVMQLEAGTIYLLDENKRTLLLHAHYGLSEEYISEQGEIPLGKDIPGLVAQSGSVIVAEDLDNDTRDEKTLLKIKEGIVSLISVPLVSKDKVMGVMNLANRSIRKFNKWDIKLFISIGDEIGVAIENAKLYDAIEKWNEELEIKIEERTRELIEARKAMINMLEDSHEAYQDMQLKSKELKEAQERLIQSEKMAVVGQVAAAVSHDLRNPLNNIKLQSYYLKNKLDHIAPELSNLVNDIEQEVEHANTIISDVLEFSRPRDPVFIMININEIIEDTLMWAAQHDILSGVNVSKNLLSDLPSTLIDRDQIKRMIQNLITNASHAMAGNGDLIISTDIQKNMIEIKVADTGPGMDEETRKNVFTPFYTTKSQGVGLGLTIVRDIIKRHEGTIKLVTGIGKGTVFIISLPVKQRKEMD